MAKTKNALIKLSGTLYDVTFVDSKAYGKHARSPRGTHKKAEINAVLLENSRKTDVINNTAQVIHDHFKDIGHGFKEGRLWQALLSCFFTAPTTSLADLYTSIQGLELNRKYPLNRLVLVPQLSVYVRKGKLRLNLEPQHHPHFSKQLEVDGYFYTVHLLYLDSKGEAIDTDGIETEWVHFTDEVPFYELSFDVPLKICYYILVLEVVAGYKQVPLDVFPAKGMRVLAAGKK